VRVVGVGTESGRDRAEAIACPVELGGERLESWPRSPRVVMGGTSTRRGAGLAGEPVDVDADAGLPKRARAGDVTGVTEETMRRRGCDG
jgi:hypothetical protein